MVDKEKLEALEGEESPEDKLERETNEKIKREFDVLSTNLKKTLGIESKEAETTIEEYVEELYTEFLWLISEEDTSDTIEQIDVRGYENFIYVIPAKKFPQNTTKIKLDGV